MPGLHALRSWFLFFLPSGAAVCAPAGFSAHLRLDAEGNVAVTYGRITSFIGAVLLGAIDSEHEELQN